MKTITRHSNRKLYSKDVHGYINLPEVLEMVQKGEKIQILEYKTNKDVTNNILREAVVRYVPFTTEQLISLARGSNEG